MRIDWINNIVTAIISIVVTVVAGVFLYYWQLDKTELTYKFERIEPFDNQTEKLTIYHIQIENNGSTVIEDVEGVIFLENSQITDYKATSKTLLSKIDTLKNNSIYLNIKSLNKEEACKVSILAKSNSELPIEPTIKLRGKGVTAIKKDASKNDGFDFSLILKLLVLLSALATTTSIVSKRFIGNLTGSHTDGDQNHIFSFFCGIYNLPDEVERLMKMTETTYWAEADRFRFLAVNSNNIDYQNKVIKIIENVINYSGKIADNSEAICYYNIAKIYLKQGNQEKYNEFIDKAKKNSKKLIEKRLKYEGIN